jgi:pimeloyl-ACP methyl ester carboxylesterase
MSSAAQPSLHIHDTGSGPAILWVHGFPLDHTMWQCQYEELNEYRSIAVDLRGFGRSSGEGEFCMADLATDLKQLVKDQIGDAPFVYAGLSMGGYVAWEFLNDRPPNLAGLILCDTKSAADGEEMKKARRLSAKRVLEEGPAAIVDPMLKKLFAEPTFERLPDRVLDTREVMLSTSAETIANALNAMADRPDSTHQLGQIDIPTLLICGEFDQISTVDEMQKMAEQIPDSEMAIIANAGHMAPLEQPGAVNIVVRKFVRRVLSSP